MKVSELIVKLSELNADADVLFDTEAQHYDVHLVPIDMVHPIPAEAIGREVVCLSEDYPHRLDNCEDEISALRVQLAASQSECERLRVDRLHIAESLCGGNPLTAREAIEYLDRKRDNTR